MAVGTKVIEKHFTLDKDMVGLNHKVSVTLEELKQLVSDIRRVGNSKKDKRSRDFGVVL